MLRRSLVLAALMACLYGQSIRRVAPGFKKSIIDDVNVDTSITTTVDVHLETGTVSTEVTVVAQAAGVNTESGTTSSTVLDLAITLPNVPGDVGSEDSAVTSGATVPGFNLSINGGRAGSSVRLADGAVNTGVGLARSVVSFSPETVQEFTVQCTRP